VFNIIVKKIKLKHSNLTLQIFFFFLQLLQFEQSHIRAIDFRAADFEQFVFEQLHSSNLPRFAALISFILNNKKDFDYLSFTSQWPNNFERF
jgi:hypothetical protein